MASKDTNTKSSVHSDDNPDDKTREQRALDAIREIEAGNADSTSQETDPKSHERVGKGPHPNSATDSKSKS